MATIGALFIIYFNKLYLLYLTSAFTAADFLHQRRVPTGQQKSEQQRSHNGCTKPLDTDPATGMTGIVRRSGPRRKTSSAG